ncbi:Ger(x)C family spore germination protein [Fictibacillus gelatini]|uniref:Ger(x)C family spore germination protein n=1 Tax=Fictibacillus gelatini TaxID=225985 RepID=UPI000415470E|nr:Ger(x)C family spore germination protein [Fictibacillus gelatini]
MKRSVISCALIIFCLMTMTGCWDRKELNELAIAMGIGIDKDGDQYVVTAQVVNPGEVAAQKGAAVGRAPVITFQAKDKTIYEAIRKITKESPRKIYSSHLRVLVIGEDLAREGIGRSLDLLSRNQELRTDFYVMIAKGMKASDVLNVTTSLEKIPSNKIFYALETSDKVYGPTYKETLDDLISTLVTHGKQPAITGVVLKGNEHEGAPMDNVAKTDPDARIKVDGIAIFKKDKLKGWLKEAASAGYVITTDQLSKGIMHVKCPKGGKAAVEIINAKTKIKTKVVNGQPEAFVYVRQEGNVGEVECHIDLTKPESITQLEKGIEKRNVELVKTSIKEVKRKYKIDSFGFGEAVHRSNPEYWKKAQKNWDKIFVHMPVHVKAEMKIRRVGTIGNSFIEEMKE